MERRPILQVEHSGFRGEVFELYDGEKRVGAGWELQGGEHREQLDEPWADASMMEVRCRRYIDNEIRGGDGSTTARVRQ